MVELNERTPSPHSTLDLWQLGGAFALPDPQDTAFGDARAFPARHRMQLGTCGRRRRIHRMG